MTVGRAAREDRSPAVRAALARLSPRERLAQLTSAVAPTGRWEGPGPAPGVLLVPAAALGAGVPAPPPGPGVPPLLLAVGPHPGPHSLPPPAAAATWDVDLVERLAHRAAAELRHAGLHGHLLPVGAVGDPLPGAVDPTLAADVLAAHVRGTQGAADRRDDPLGPDRALAVVAPLGPWPDAQWHERTLRADVLRPLEAAVRAGAAVVVPAPAANAGVPAHTDAWLLRDVLRRDWGFDGVVLAHPGALDDLVARYRVARSAGEAVALAVEAGVDVVGSSSGPAQQLAELVAGGALAGWLVDDAVAAVLTLKARLGLLDGPSPPSPAPGGRALTRLALVRSSVLLSDPSGALPLPARGSVHVVDDGPAGADGPARRLVAALAADRPGAAVGHRGAPDRTAPAETTVLLTARGDAGAARRAAAVVAAGGNCVVVVTGARPAALRALVATTACVLLCWRDPTTDAGALVALLTGAVEPAGRLPLGPTGRPGPPAAGSFPTGHGLGGTTFGYARLVVSPPVLDGGDLLRVQCSVTNTGERDGREVVQVYLGDPVGRTVHVPGPVLAGFEAVEVPAGRTVAVTVTLPLDRLAVWDRTMRRRVEPGTVDVLVGRSATDIRLRATVRVAAHPSHWRADR